MAGVYPAKIKVKIKRRLHPVTNVPGIKGKYTYGDQLCRHGQTPNQLHRYPDVRDYIIADVGWVGTRKSMTNDLYIFSSLVKTLPDKLLKCAIKYITYRGGSDSLPPVWKGVAATLWKPISGGTMWVLDVIDISPAIHTHASKILGFDTLHTETVADLLNNVTPRLEDSFRYYIYHMYLCGNGFGRSNLFA